MPLILVISRTTYETTPTGSSSTNAGGNVSRVSEYNIAQKFGTTVNELISMSEYVYQ